MKFLIAGFAAIALIAGHAPHASLTPPPFAPAIRLAQCEGPAFSLPDSLARQVPPRTMRMVGDDRWAELARTVPGGFAGIFYDSTHTPILLLTQPAQAAAAHRALAGKIELPPDAVVRRARWDFAQLVDWFNYLLPRLSVGGITADKDESINRIRLSVTSLAARDSVIRDLAALPLPCDLVVVDLRGLTIQF